MTNSELSYTVEPATNTSIPTIEANDSTIKTNIKALFRRLERDIYAHIQNISSLKSYSTAEKDEVDINELNSKIDGAVDTSNEVALDFKRICAEFPSFLLASEQILDEDPGSICADFIRPLISDEYSDGIVIDEVLEKAVVIIPQIGNMHNLPRMIKTCNVYIEHDPQVTHTPRIVINIIPNINNVPSSVYLYATHIIDLKLVDDPTKVQVEYMELAVDQFQLELIENMFLDIEKGNIVKEIDS